MPTKRKISFDCFITPPGEMRARLYFRIPTTRLDVGVGLSETRSLSQAFAEVMPQHQGEALAVYGDLRVVELSPPTPVPGEGFVRLTDGTSFSPIDLIMHPRSSLTWSGIANVVDRLAPGENKRSFPSLGSREPIGIFAGAPDQGWFCL